MKTDVLMPIGCIGGDPRRQVDHRCSRASPSRRSWCAIVARVMPGLPAPYGEALAKMDRSFLTTAIVPTTVFMTAYGALLVNSFWSFGDAADWWSEQATAVQLAVALVATAAVWFIASLFSSNWRRIVRLYEGYPLSRLLPEAEDDPASQERRRAWIRRLPGFAWHLERQRRLERGDVRGGLTMLYYRYPGPEFDYQTLPTTVGNILLAGERYGLDRYGLDPTVLWPRLFWCLPESVQSALERFKEQHQLPLALSFVSGVFTAASAITLLAASENWQLFAGICGTGLLVSLGTYWLAVERTEEYAEQLRTAIDLYHQELKNSWVQPCRESSEANWFASARNFVLRGADPQCRPERLGGTAVDPIGASDSSLVARLLVSVRHAIARHNNTQQEAPQPPPPELPNISGRLTSRWEDIICHLRPLPAVAVIGATAILAARRLLYRQSTTVLVAARPAQPGDVVAVETKQQRTWKLRDDAVPAGDLDRLFYAAAPIAPQTVLTPVIARDAKTLLRLTLPVSQGTAPATPPLNRTAKALIAPCGVVLNQATITSWNNAEAGVLATLLIASEEATKLGGCRAESVTVLVPAT